jgi:hypothetical protein
MGKPKVTDTVDVPEFNIKVDPNRSGLKTAKKGQGTKIVRKTKCFAVVASGVCRGGYFLLPNRE